MKKIIVMEYVNDELRREEYTRKELTELFGITPMELIKEKWKQVNELNDDTNRIKINIINEYSGKEWQFMNKAEAQSWGFNNYINII